MANALSRLLVRVSAPATEPLTLAETKLYLRVDHASEDALISDLIVAARMMAENHLRRSLVNQSWKVAYDDYLPAEVTLPMGPVASITSVTMYGRDGSSQPIGSEVYYLNAAKNILRMDSPLYVVSPGHGARVEVVYATGYGNAAAVPKPIKQGMLAHIAQLYDNRGIPLADPGAGGWESSAMAMPQLTRHLYLAYREIGL